ncbi:MAG: CvpA family protein [Pseudomonadota bacterium]
MYWPDITITGTLAFFTIKSAIRGFVREISSLLALAAGFLAASAYYSSLSQKCSSLSANDSIRNIFSFLLIFFLIYFACILLGLVGKKVMKVSLLGWFDHLAGGVLGLVKGLYIICMVLIILVSFFPNKISFLATSKAWEYLDAPMRAVLLLVPKALKTSFVAQEKSLPGFSLLRKDAVGTQSTDSRKPAIPVKKK